MSLIPWKITANQGFAHRIDPCVLCAYEIDYEDVADLTTVQGRREYSVTFDALACAWATALADGERPASWSVYDRLKAEGIAGILGSEQELLEIIR